MATDLKINPARREDLPRIIELGQRMHEGSTFADMDFDPEVTAQTMIACMDAPNGTVLVARKRGHIIGGVAAVTMPSFFGRDTVASDLAVFVEAGKRGRAAGYFILEAYVDWAKAQGVKRINLGNSAGTNDAAYQKLTGRLGFSRAGALMYLRV